MHALTHEPPASFLSHMEGRLPDNSQSARARRQCMERRRVRDVRQTDRMRSQEYVPQRIALCRFL